MLYKGNEYSSLSGLHLGFSSGGGGLARVNGPNEYIIELLSSLEGIPSLHEAVIVLAATTIPFSILL